MEKEYKNLVLGCQNCQKDFTIETDDFSYYEKIKVPPPTFCPECRMKRRLNWRNVRSLYKRACGLCKKNLISMYRDDGAPVYCNDCYNGDGWDYFQFGQDIDWSKNFLQQILEIFKKQPRIYQYRIGNVVNSDYGNSVVNSKNAYMTFSVIDSEDIMYSENIDRSKNCIDCFTVSDLDQCSWNIISDKNYNSHFVVSAQSCIDSYFLYDCTNCQNCCLSSNLRNQQYVFMNKKLSKEEYMEAVKGLKLEAYSGFERAKEMFQQVYRSSIHKYANIVSSQNVLGDFIYNSKNVFKSFDVRNSSEDVRYSARIIKSKDVVDCFATLTGELAYECLSASDNTYRQIASVLCFQSKNMSYSLFCKNCSDCFGCIGLKNANFCILNKQYSEEEYNMLVPQIKKFMDDMPYVDTNGRVYGFGEFFPFEFSPFGYNETVANDFFPLSEHDALELGYNWKGREKREYAITKNATDLPDSIIDTSDDILNETIGCPNDGNPLFQCTTAFRITQNELIFYRNKNLPIPRYCPNCRHYERLAYRNTMHLYQRQCMCEKNHSNHVGFRCPSEFDTSYAPERLEMVYCEKCYQQEVY